MPHVQHDYLSSLIQSDHCFSGVVGSFEVVSALIPYSSKCEPRQSLRAMPRAFLAFVCFVFYASVGRFCFSAGWPKAWLRKDIWHSHRGFNTLKKDFYLVISLVCHATRLLHCVHCKSGQLCSTDPQLSMREEHIEFCENSTKLFSSTVTIL